MNLKKVASLSFVAGLLAIAGCAGVAPENLKIPKERRALLLKDPVRYETSSLFGSKTQITIAAGIYNAVRQDDAGMFYRGPPHFASSFFNNTGMQSTAEGGIYLPAVATQPARIFVVIGSGSRSRPANSNAAVSDAVQRTSMTNISPIVAGAGAAIGAGLVAALSDAEMGRYNILADRSQPPGNVLREALVTVPAGTTFAAGALSNPSEIGKDPASNHKVRVTGNDTYAAEKLAKAKSCADNPLATLTSKGPGFEEYAVPCTSGAQMKLRCEFGGCEVQP